MYRPDPAGASMTQLDSQFWHNPACSKSREALGLLRARGVDIAVVLYLDAPPTVGTLREVMGMLGMKPRTLMRTGEADYLRFGLDDAALDDDALLAAMRQHPHLIERPIFVHGMRAVIGRPPERVLDLLDLARG